jgi:hypothetical protein
MDPRAVIILTPSSRRPESKLGRSPFAAKVMLKFEYVNSTVTGAR